MSVRLIDYAHKHEYEGKPGGYLEIYDRHFSTIRYEPIKLLEIGVAKGVSMLMWRDYFPNATIVGLDLLPEFQTTDRIHIYKGRQNDTDLLTRIAREQAPEGFDIIIDDAAHIGEMAKVSFWHLFNYLKPGGFYAIEDWGTGYWGNHVYYPDGDYFKVRADNGFLHWFANRVLKYSPVEWPKLSLLGKLLRRHQYTREFPSHLFGMAGFVKQLVDEISIAEITSPKHGVKTMGPHRRTTFKDILITPGVVLVTKL